MELNNLYQEIILDHYRHPCNFHDLSDRPQAVSHDNAICGDQIRLVIVVADDGTLQDIQFDGTGCAISMASASMMTRELKGKPLGEAKAAIQHIVTALRGEGDDRLLDCYGDLVALKGVIKFPLRVKCATLAWHALKDAIFQEEHAWNEALISQFATT
jgi:nitrogen fixation NifU-like protein